MDVVGLSKPLGLSKQAKLCQGFFKTKAPSSHLSLPLHMLLITEVPSQDIAPKGLK